MRRCGELTGIYGKETEKTGGVPEWSFLYIPAALSAPPGETGDPAARLFPFAGHPAFVVGLRGRL